MYIYKFVSVSVSYCLNINTSLYSTQKEIRHTSKIKYNSVHNYVISSTDAVYDHSNFSEVKLVQSSSINLAYSVVCIIICLASPLSFYDIQKVFIKFLRF